MSLSRRAIVALSLPVALALASSRLAAAPPAPQPGKATAKVAATVNGQNVSVNEVARIVRQSLKDRPVPDGARPLVEAQALEQAIDQRLVTGWLDREKQGVSEPEVETELRALKSQAERLKVPFAEWLSQQSTDEVALRQELAWRLGWRRYLAREINDAALERFFADHRREYDGTQIRASHILWKVDASAGQSAALAAMEQASDVRQQIVAGQLSFAEAAARHSQAPTGKQGGDLGFFPRRGVMEEPLSRAAFALKPGAVSEPVASSFGVHLVQCIDERPGDKKWSDVRSGLEEGLTVELFTRLAQAERKAARIEYTGAAAHFRPGTRDVVSPK